MRLIFMLLFFCLFFQNAYAGDRLIMKPGKESPAVAKPENKPKEPVKRQKTTDSAKIWREKDGLRKGQTKNGRYYEWRLENLTAVEAECIIDASKRFSVPAALILTILDVEGGEVGVRAKNNNGTWDMGPMQVNTCHMEELSPFGLTEREIEENGCLNIQVGAWLLKRQMTQTGNIAEAVGRYHSWREPHKGRYQRKAAIAYKQIKADPAKHIERIMSKANNSLGKM